MNSRGGLRIFDSCFFDILYKNKYFYNTYTNGCVNIQNLSRKNKMDGVQTEGVILQPVIGAAKTGFNFFQRWWGEKRGFNSLIWLFDALIGLKFLLFIIFVSFYPALFGAAVLNPFVWIGMLIFALTYMLGTWYVGWQAGKLNGKMGIPEISAIGTWVVYGLNLLFIAFEIIYLIWAAIDTEAQ